MAKIGRNDPCPCGSGTKYKKCCIDKVPEIVPAPRAAIPFEFDGELQPDLRSYLHFRLFENSEEFERLKRHAPEKARRFWTIAKVADLGTEDIVGRLAAYGIDASASVFIARAERQPSGWAIADRWFEDGARTPDEFAGDFVYLAACELWKRYLPERPSVEMLDDWIHEGYELLERRAPLKACDRWWQAWMVIRDRLEPHMTTTEAAAPVFDGVQCLFNWTQDLSMELGNAHGDGPQYTERGIELCERILDQFIDEPSQDYLLAFRVDLANFLSMAGRTDEGEQILSELIEDVPNQSMGYASLADQLAYPSDAAGRSPDLRRAIEILERAMRYPVVDAQDYDLQLRLDGFKRAAEHPDDGTPAAPVP